jgi:type II secretory pathway component PulC
MNFKKPLLLINICLAILVLCIALNTFHTWNSKRHEKIRLQAEVFRTKRLNGKTSAKPKKPGDYEVIIRRDIFKTKKVPQKAITEQEKTIKITDLNLKLMGTVVGKDRDCFAIILDGSTKKLDLYHLNDFIQGTRIVGILSDRVILNLEGREEYLMFTDEPGPSVRKTPSKKKRPTRTRKKRKRPAI